MKILVKEAKGKFIIYRGNYPTGRLWYPTWASAQRMENLFKNYYFTTIQVYDRTYDETHRGVYIWKNEKYDPDVEMVFTCTG